MPKSKRIKFLDLVRRLAPATFSSNDEVVFCKLYSKAFPNARKFTLEQHLQTKLHKETESRRESQPVAEQRQLLTSVSDAGNRSKFATDLYAAFMAVDIPLHKLLDPRLKDFLEEYTLTKVPDQLSDEITLGLSTRRF